MSTDTLWMHEDSDGDTTRLERTSDDREPLGLVVDGSRVFLTPDAARALAALLLAEFDAPERPLGMDDRASSQMVPGPALFFITDKGDGVRLDQPDRRTDLAVVPTFDGLDQRDVAILYALVGHALGDRWGMR